MTEHEKQELCVAYFRQNHAYDRAFQMMRKKWRKYGRVAGTIKLEHADTHAFARNTVPGRLLIQALSCLHGDMDSQNAEDVLSLYYMAGIKPDDISSFTTAYGIHLYQHGEEHTAYLSFIEKAESYVITLSNLSHVEQARIKGENVYVVENQMVFSYLCKALEGREVALVYTSGQLKTASLILLDMLRSAGYTIYYSGDFDPKGIGIAEKIIRKSRGRAKLWHMSKRDYESAISNETIRQERLRKLEKIDLECFSEVKTAI